MQPEITNFQSMILSEFANRCVKDTSNYDWVLELDSKPKFDNVCLSNHDTQTHILNKNKTTCCGLPVSVKREIIGEIWYCNRCLLYKH